MTPAALGLIKKRIATGRAFAAGELCAFANRRDIEALLRDLARDDWIECDQSNPKIWVATAFGLSVMGDG